MSAFSQWVNILLCTSTIYSQLEFCTECKAVSWDSNHLATLMVPTLIQSSMNTLLVGRQLVGRIARLVFKVERLEGNFRFAHMRLRGAAEEAALWRAARPELKGLDHSLGALLRGQRRLVMSRWGLGATTVGLEYSGALLNYCCVALIIFTGGWQPSLL